MSFKVDNFSEYLIKAKNGFKTNAQDNSNAPKSPHLKSHLTNLKQSSKDTFTNTASQNAKQDIEKALDAKSIDEVKNILFSKNPEFTKKKLALCAGLLIAYVGIAAIKKPHALKEVIFNLISSAKIKKNRVHFNEEKIFDGPIDLNKMYEKAKEKVKNVTLNLAFDEKTITDDKLTEALRSFGVYEYRIQSEKDKIKNNPALMHLFNIMAGFTSPKNKKMFSYFEYSHMNNTMATPDEIETYFKVIKKGLSQNQNLFIPTLHNGKFREAVEITGLYQEILKRCKIPKGFSETCITRTESLNKENQEKFLNFIASLKKGTVLNNPWSLRNLFSYSQDADYLKMQRIYENLKSNIVNKIDLQELENFANCEFKKSTELVKILNEAPEEVIDKLRGWELLTYVNFNEFYGAKNINQLSMQQKKLLLRRLISSNSDTFSSGKKIAPVLPSNQKEYCTLLDRLAKSIGVDTKPLTKDELTAFKKGINNIKDYIQGIDFNNVTIDMAFTRADFVKQTQEVLSKLSEAQKAEVMDYFGFEIQNGILKGYPINVNNGEKMKEISSHAAKKAIEKLRPIVQKFSTNNQIQIKGASKEFNDCLNQILKGLPELRTIIGRVQHETHAFTLDIHTFKVLQNVCTNPKFKNLSAEDKKVLEIASLLHDITKTEGLRDAMHPIESAFDAYYIIQKLNLPENQQLKIYELIRTHNWLQQLNNPKNKDIVENIAQDIAFDTRFSNIFDMAKILCEADLKSVKKDASFFKNYENVLEQMSAKVDGYVQSLHNSQIFLPQTRIPKASEIKNGIIKSADGIQNTVIYMDKLDDDLSKYGFDEGTTKSNWTALVHALEYDQQMSKFNTFSIVDNEALLSTSFINPKEYKVFRNQGLILNVNTSDIHAGYERDFGTGYSKSIELLKQDYLFHGKRKNVDQLDGWRKHNGSEYRNFIPQKIQQKAGLTPEEYYQKLSQIQDCTSITDIEKVDKDFAEVLLDVFNDMHKGKRRGGRNYNEILVSRPKIQGVFAYDEDYEKIPAFLRQFAQDNNLPIIIFGK